MTKIVEVLTSLAAIAVVAWPAVVAAHETDQFSNRADPIADSTDVLNRQVNKSIAEVVRKWHGDENRMAFVNALYRRLGSRFLADRIEKWAINSPEVEKARMDRYDSVYSIHPFWAIRITKLVGVGQAIRVNNQRIGTDKLGHFVSQGRKYYGRFLRYHSEEKAVRQSAFAEWWVFG